jgi:hypothetical protein
LEELRARLGLEAGEVMTDGRLGVVELLSRRRHRAAAGDRLEDAQPGDVEHPSRLSMSDRRLDQPRQSQAEAPIDNGLDHRPSTYLIAMST